MRKENSSNTLNEKEILNNCPITTFFHILGGRWKLPILWNLRESGQRFFELQQLIPAISDKMLSQQLKDLQTLGFIKRRVFDEMPIKISYELTESGTKLIPILQQIYNWGNENEVLNLL